MPYLFHDKIYPFWGQIRECRGWSKTFPWIFFLRIYPLYQALFPISKPHSQSQVPSHLPNLFFFFGLLIKRSKMHREVTKSALILICYQLGIYFIPLNEFFSMCEMSWLLERMSRSDLLICYSSLILPQFRVICACKTRFFNEAFARGEYFLPIFWFFSSEKMGLCH